MAKLISIQPDFPKGDAEFEAERRKIIDDVLDKIPKDLILPENIINEPPPRVMDIPRDSKLLTKQEIEITENYDLVGLAKEIAEKRLTSVDVTRAFCRRAAIAHQVK